MDGGSYGRVGGRGLEIARWRGKRREEESFRKGKNDKEEEAAGGMK